VAYSITCVEEKKEYLDQNLAVCTRKRKYGNRGFFNSTVNHGCKLRL